MSRYPTCLDCGAPLVFIVMESGKKMPCDPDQVYSDGRRHLVVRETVGEATRGGERVVSRLVTRAPEGTVGFQPHFGTCPARKKPKPVQTNLFA